MSDAKKRLDKIVEDADEALRYGELWTQFNVIDHVFYARYKAKRAGVLWHNGDFMNARDDLIDALNSIRFAIDEIDRESAS